MPERPDPGLPSTSAAASAVAQTREGGGGEGAAAAGASPPPGISIPLASVAECAGEGTDFRIGAGVARGALVRPYERLPDDPLYRPLRIFTLDPAASRMEGAVAVVNVPYEPLAPGPAGSVFRVDPRDADTGDRYRTANLEDPGVLIRDGRTPSPADPRFHQQMVYAVCSLVYASFRSALGRHVAWGFDAHPDDAAAGRGARLALRPHGGRARNAWYDPDRGELRFGYFRGGKEVAGRNVPGGFVFTCLSHDVVAHEVTHALLDGLRAHFTLPTGPDVLGFHEGFADLVAIFQHFSYPDVVRAAIRASRGVLTQAALLTDLARQFGHTTARDEKAEEDGYTARPLRTAVQVNERGELVPRKYRAEMEAHDMGAVLVSAVFSAFLTVFRRKTERYVRLATGGTGVTPEGEIPPDLQAVLAEEASQLASQFLAACIRAVDYCPPVDLHLGEYLRALITADHDLVPDDPWGYREAWIDAFGEHGIYPPQVRSLAEDELRWKPPARAIDPLVRLSFKHLRFEGDPAHPADADELRRQACALGRMVVENLGQFGMAARDDPRLDGDEVDLPEVQSIRTSRRVGPDGQVVFDLVAEVTQRRTVRDGGFDLYGGATVILGPRGEVRYVIAKNVANRERRSRMREFVHGEGARYWEMDGGVRRASRKVFRMLHDEKGRAGG